MGYKVNKRYVGTQKVRPMIKTYILEKTTSTSSTYYASINDTTYNWEGYKIKNFLIETTFISKNTSQDGRIGINLCNGDPHTLCIQANANVGVNATSYLEYQYSGSYTTVSSSLGTVYSNGTNTLSMNITSEGVVTTILNGNKNTFTLTGNGKLSLDGILNGNSIFSQAYCRWAEIGPTTVTIKYATN